jgi:hypothetical protein
MAFCTECGKQMGDDAKFCPECGKPVSAAAISPEQAVKNVPPRIEPPPLPAQEKRKMSEGKKGCFGCLGVIVVLIIIGAIFGIFNDSSKNSSPSSKQATQQTQKQEPKQKTEQELYTYKCQVEGVGTVRGAIASNVGVAIAKIQERGSIDNSFSSTKAQGVFKVVYIVATNYQKDAVTMDANSVKLIDDKGREFSHSIPAETALQMNGKETLFLEGINPGNTTGGYIAFDVPKSANIVKMQFTGGFTGKKGEVPFKVMMVE